MKLLPKALLLAITITCATAPGAVAEKRVALVIGNERYTSVPPLPNPGRDARTVAAALRNLGFSLVGGGPQIDLDKVRADAMVELFQRNAKNADIALFYFAGHGMQVDGVNYLAPVDLKPSSRITIGSYTLNANVLLRVMESSGARLKILLLDACRTNPFFGQRDGGGGLAPMRAPRGTVIGFATQPDAVASDGPDGGNGPYATALVTYLQVRGLELQKLLNNVGLAVMDATDNEQQPWTLASAIRGEVILNRLPAGAIAGLPASPPNVNYEPPTRPQSPSASLAPASSYIQEARKQLDQKNYSEARVLLGRAIDADPTSALAYSYRGFVWYLEGSSKTDHSEALAAYHAGFPDLDKAIQLDPNYAPVRRHRGNMIVATYRARKGLRKPVNDILDRAVDDLKEAVRLDPNSKVNANALGEAYLLKGNNDLAIDAFNNAIAKDTSYAAPYAGICVAYRMQGRQEEAHRYAQKAAARDSDLRSMPCLTRSL
jgi:tetratricopeptide (TPR) repeat protein